MSFVSQSLKIAVAAVAVAAGIAAGPANAAPSTGSSGSSGSAGVSQDQEFLYDLEDNGIDTDRYDTGDLVNAAYEVCSLFGDGYSWYYVTDSVYYASDFTWTQATAFVDVSVDNYCPAYGY